MKCMQPFFLMRNVVEHETVAVIRVQGALQESFSSGALLNLSRIRAPCAQSASAVISRRGHAIGRASVCEMAYVVYAKSNITIALLFSADIGS